MVVGFGVQERLVQRKTEEETGRWGVADALAEAVAVAAVPVAMVDCFWDFAGSLGPRCLDHLLLLFFHVPMPVQLVQYYVHHAHAHKRIVEVQIDHHNFHVRHD